LLSLNVLEHEFGFWERNIVGENFAILLVELEDFGKSLVCFCESIESLQELTHVIIDQVVFEYTDNVGVFVVDYICHYFGIVVLS